MIIKPLSGSIGAEVFDLDLNSLDGATLHMLEVAFNEHLVLCFREQDFSPAKLLSVSRAFASVGRSQHLLGMKGYPEIVPVVKEAGEISPTVFGGNWHTDSTFLSAPPSRTFLYAVDCPAVGGDTLFSNLYLAYESLSPGLQGLLEGVRAVHSSAGVYGEGSELDSQLENMKLRKDVGDALSALHPVIRVNPATGKFALWINPLFVSSFEAMSVEESQQILGYLNSIAVTPSYTCRVRWEKGTLVMWDNRCTQHCALSDYSGSRREMWRIEGEHEIPIPAVGQR